MPNLQNQNMTNSSTDPEVATLATLTNVQNSLFVPQLGRFVNRNPTYRVSEGSNHMRSIDRLKLKLKEKALLAKDGDEDGSRISRLLGRTSTKIPDKFEYAILPDGEELEDWTKEDKEEMDDLVRHNLHSKKAKFSRSMKGFRQYIRRPFGLFITVYATLITLFGAAWVLFLIGWISVGSKKDYVVNVVDNVLVGLFAIIGDGLAPFRAVDTYHMVYIAYYHRKTWKKRENLGLPELKDHNDLPEQRKEEVPLEDLESATKRKMPNFARRLAPIMPNAISRHFTKSRPSQPSYDYTVLTPTQQAKLDHHSRKFSKSHTFYKPHETETHFAFPLKLLVLVVLLLDCHSMLQITLGACTWGIPYETRPFALTTVVLCFSITCNILGGVVISIGDKRTRKHAVIERLLRQELTAECIDAIETRRIREAEARGEINPAMRRRAEEARRKEEEEDMEIKKSWKTVPLLPKKLLGKGEDKRQPSLPQSLRGSSSNVEASNSKPVKDEKGDVPMEVLQERPEPKEGRGQRFMKSLRKADLDRS